MKTALYDIWMTKPGRERFEVRYYDLDGSMQRLSFATRAMASKFAETTIPALSVNRENFVTLRGTDAFDCRSAVELLAAAMIVGM